MVEPTPKRYQTHGADQPGMSDTQKKLARLMLPSDLTGKRVLDIGCNEGFFSHECVKRGAQSVIGIDGHRPFLDIAEQLYPNQRLKFLHQRWSTLPDGEFDIILWISAMHYEHKPIDILRQIRERLAGDGLFILECGVLDWPSKEMVLRARHDHSLWYPTWPLLEEMLADFGVRRVASPAMTVGDTVPRAVFHCQPRKPMVLLIRGKHLAGKSFLASCLATSSTKVMSCDSIMARIANGQHHNSKFEKFVRDNFADSIYEKIDQEGMTQEYAKLLVETIVSSDRLVVIEGALTEPQSLALTSRLAGFARVWDAQRR